MPPRHFPVKAPVPECAVRVTPNQAEHRLFGYESFQPFVKAVVVDAGVITVDIRARCLRIQTCRPNLHPAEFC